MKSANCRGHNKSGQIYQIVFLSFCMIFCGCTEPFDITNEGIEDFLVINALITDEVKKQKILVSRTIGFEDDDTPTGETGATIIVKEDNTVEYTFEETAPGVYGSVQSFGVETGKTYELLVSTQNQRSYRSEKVIAPVSTSIEDISARRIINDDGVPGIGIFLDSKDSTGNSRYYRFQFEETFRVIAPLWIATDVVPNYNVCSGKIIFDIVNRPEYQKECYRTQVSQKIDIANTQGLQEDRIVNRMINFIPVDDIRIENRYSILVKQFVQTRETYSFYNALSDFSSSENIFTQIQPGFISGNISSENDSDENVVGFFDVSSIASQRIFINREDLIDEDEPRFYLDCGEVTPVPGPLEDVEAFRSRLAGTIRTNELRVIRVGSLPNPDCNPESGPGGIPQITFVPRVCGDCTSLGQSETPDFWID